MIWRHMKRMPRPIQLAIYGLLFGIILWGAFIVAAHLPVFPYFPHCWHLNVDLDPHLSDEFLIGMVSGITDSEFSHSFAEDPDPQYRLMIWNDRLFYNYDLWALEGSLILNLQDKSVPRLVSGEFWIEPPPNTNDPRFKEALAAYHTAYSENDVTKRARAWCRLLELAAVRNPPANNRFQ